MYVLFLTWYFELRRQRKNDSGHVKTETGIQLSNKKVKLQTKLITRSNWKLKNNCETLLISYFFFHL